MSSKRNVAGVFLRIDADQKDALDRIAEERNVPVAALLREAISTITGVPDPIRRLSKSRDT